jgi:hypothetical protein
LCVQLLRHLCRLASCGVEPPDTTCPKLNPQSVTTPQKSVRCLCTICCCLCTIDANNCFCTSIS